MDGFAGPGQHDNGDIGSPLIAYETVVNHQLEHNFKAQIMLIFVEAEMERAENLQKCLNAARRFKKSEKGKIYLFNYFNV